MAVGSDNLFEGVYLCQKVGPKIEHSEKKESVRVLTAWEGRLNRHAVISGTNLFSLATPGVLSILSTILADTSGL